MIDTPPYPLPTAVLFLVFNRPRQTAVVFEAIRKAKPSRLFVASDGPRYNKEGETERVELVRTIATSVDWDCEVNTLFRKSNLGCKYAVSGAISWFFDLVNEGIILEDDCLPSQSFFWFCKEMLERYRYDRSVMAITGTNIISDFSFNADYFFSRYALMWGWASWASAWKKYDLELATWPSKHQIKHLKVLGVTSLIQSVTWKNILTQTKAKSIDTWDYQWIYSCWLHNGLTVAPSKNLIRNIGYSEDATHTVVTHPVLSNLLLNELTWPLRAPRSIEPHTAADAYISRHWFGVGWKALTIYHMQKLLGVAKLKQLSKVFVRSLSKLIVKA